MDSATLFTKALALFTMLGNVASFVCLILAVALPAVFDRVMNILSRHVLSLGLFLTACSTIGSIVYSEVVGFSACILCWIQRIFMYPQMFLFGLALWRREFHIVPYVFFLSVLGGSVSLYQWVKDMLALYVNVDMPCPAVSLLPSCDTISVIENGYITIPMIALNAFILIGIVMYARMRRKS